MQVFEHFIFPLFRVHLQALLNFNFFPSLIPVVVFGLIPVHYFCFNKEYGNFTKFPSLNLKILIGCRWITFTFEAVSILIFFMVMFPIAYDAETVKLHDAMNEDVAYSLVLVEPYDFILFWQIDKKLRSVLRTDPFKSPSSYHGVEHTPQIKPERSLFLRLRYELEKVPRLRGWIIIGYTVFLVALVAAAYLTTFLNPTKDMLFAFSTMMETAFIVLLAAFLGVYFALLTIIENRLRNTQKEQIEIESEPDLSPVFPTIAILREMRNSILYSMSFVILVAMIVVFFSSPLLTNPSYATFTIFIMLEMSIVAGWLFLRFMVRIAMLSERVLGGKR